MSTPHLSADGLPDPRRHYWRYQHLQHWLATIARDHPDIVVVERYGSSAEGRPLYVVKVGTEPGRARPAPLFGDPNTTTAGTGIQVQPPSFSFVGSLHVHQGPGPSDSG